MNKTDLKNNWGALCDTDKLVDEVMTVLTKYDHNNSEYGVCTMLNKFFDSKEWLIDKMMKSQNYLGDLRIVTDMELPGELDSNNIYNFCQTFMRDVEARQLLVSNTDEDGKQYIDYLHTGIKSLNIKDLLNSNIKDTLQSPNKKLLLFNDDNEYIPSIKRFESLRRLIQSYFGYHCCPTITSRLVGIVEAIQPEISFAEGMKTSRAFNRMCSHYGVDKLPNYNKLFAKYADMVSDSTRKLKFFVSVNPLDYLTMSFGNSWASCHTIDRGNYRGMPNSYSGQYCGGTLSYMLDSTSIITFVHKDIPTNFEEQGKIYRNMFHYEDNLLVQGRVYPQGNDGKNNLYDIFRNHMQDILSEILELNDNTWVKGKKDPNEYTNTIGVHYPDYTNFNDCNISYPKEQKDSLETYVHIGADRICVFCGGTIYSDDESPEYLTHYNCRDDYEDDDYEDDYDEDDDYEWDD